MRKIFIFVGIVVITGVITMSAQANTIPTDIYQFEDIFWYVENDYAVIIGNIYDNDMTWAEDTGTTKMVVPAEINGFPVKVFDGHFDMWSPQEVILPEGLTTIREGAFSDAPIAQISIPSTVTIIEPGAIVYCDELEEIHVEQGNKNYMVIDGILYTKDGRELICCPPLVKTDGGTLTIPEGTEIIQSFAFTNCYSIKRLIFPEGLTILENNAISENFFEEAIYFPATLEYMGEFSLSSTSCPNIYFAADSFTFESRTFESSHNAMIHLGKDITIPIADFIRNNEIEPVDFEPFVPDRPENNNTMESILPQLEIQVENSEQTNTKIRSEDTTQITFLWIVWSLILALVIGIFSATIRLFKKKR